MMCTIFVQAVKLPVRVQPMHGTLVKAVCRKPTSVGVSDDDVIVVCECMQTLDFVELEKRHTVVTRVQRL